MLRGTGQLLNFPSGFDFHLERMWPHRGDKLYPEPEGGQPAAQWWLRENLCRADISNSITGMSTQPTAAFWAAASPTQVLRTSPASFHLCSICAARFRPKFQPSGLPPLSPDTNTPELNPTLSSFLQCSTSAGFAPLVRPWALTGLQSPSPPRCCAGPCQPKPSQQHSLTSVWFLCAQSPMLPFILAVSLWARGI